MSGPIFNNAYPNGNSFVPQPPQILSTSNWAQNGRQSIFSKQVPASSEDIRSSGPLAPSGPVITSIPWGFQTNAPIHYQKLMVRHEKGFDKMIRECQLVWHVVARTNSDLGNGDAKQNISIMMNIQIANLMLREMTRNARRADADVINRAENEAYDPTPVAASIARWVQQWHFAGVCTEEEGAGRAEVMDSVMDESMMRQINYIFESRADVTNIWGTDIDQWTTLYLLVKGFRESELQKTYVLDYNQGSGGATQVYASPTDHRDDPVALQIIPWARRGCDRPTAKDLEYTVSRRVQVPTEGGGATWTTIKQRCYGQVIRVGKPLHAVRMGENARKVDTWRVMNDAQYMMTLPSMEVILQPDTLNHTYDML
jgi:hypothetical protein